MDMQDLRRVRVGYTHNCGNYQSVRLDLEFEPSFSEIEQRGLNDYIKELTTFVQSECRKMTPDYRAKELELQQISGQLRAARQAIIAIEEIAGHAPILAAISNYANAASKNLLELGYIQPTSLNEEDKDMDDEDMDDEITGEYQGGDNLPM